MYRSRMMTNEYAVTAARFGSRARTLYSIHSEEFSRGPHEHEWRAIASHEDHDVIECSRCGKQAISKAKEYLPMEPA